MNSELRPVYLHSLIKKSLEIESFEYCYFIPILAQTAEYWGDMNLVYICNMMSRQVKESFNRTAQIHFYISKNDKDVANDFLLKYNSSNFHNKMTFQKFMETLQSVEPTIPNLELSHYISETGNLPNTIPLVLDVYQFENKHLHKNAAQLEEQKWELLERISDVLDQKKILHDILETLLVNNLCDINKNHCDQLLKNMQYWKNWKANTWYPLLAQITSNNKILPFAQNFLQMSRSEKQINEIINKFKQQQYS